MRLGLVTYNLAKDWNLDTIINMCQNTGYAGVELRTGHAHLVESNLSSKQRAIVKSKFQDSGIDLVGLGTAFEYHALDPQEVRRNIEGTKEYVRLAADVGASGVKVRPNGDQRKHGIPLERTIEQIGRALRECAEFAADYGVEIRVEMHGSVADAAIMRAIIDAAERPDVYICWNSNLVDVKNGSIANDFALMKERIRLVHINELWREEYGQYPYRELAALLKQINYQGYCCAEVDGSDQPERFMRYYKALFTTYFA